ncbi:MAG: hypothetical protein HZB46_19130, partial [Solirubrobacterales bacterium]|nr:hypothetical protein [Solirubrobacterales bacterium]
MWGVRRSGAALVACAFLLPCAEAGASSCAKATAAAGRLGPVATARSLGCLLAAERARRGLGALREHRCLRRAATGHSRAMVRRRQFAHGDVGRRVRR